ncbi:hypothetical protein Fcan01_24502 [Folsomia candida]|uniref:Uncharacterized protein n=1 Tax=Folsomia candida TaxID=158441 RepID=A0A226D7C2_FOLCA|nr:hypothetical protein Fcan01_24502 [Folsomia candida]
MKLWHWTSWILVILAGLECGKSQPSLGLKKAGKGAKKPVVANPPPLFDASKELQAYRESLKSASGPAYEAGLGHGGSYRSVRAVASKAGLIDSDHAPASSNMRFLENVPNLPDKLKDIVANTYKEKIRDQMAVLSIPVEQHKHFPTTPDFSSSAKIKDLLTRDATAAEAVMKELKEKWIQAMKTGAEKGYFESPIGEEVDYYEMWEENFEAVYNSWKEKASRGKPTSPDVNAKIAHLEEMQKIYGEYWTANVVYNLKQKNFKGVMSLYITEYENYFRSNFPKYKKGLQNWLKANVRFGWLTEEEVTELIDLHDLDKGIEISALWEEVDAHVERKERARGCHPAASGDPTHSNPNLSCSPSTRAYLYRESGDSCVFLVEDADHPEEKVKEIGEEEESIFAKPKVIEDGKEITAIDSRKLADYLESVPSHEIEFDKIKHKETVVELVSKHKAKLTGDNESVRKVKALIQQELLEIHANQNSLSRALRGSGVPLTAKSISNYERVKVSASRVAERLSKFTSNTEKVGGAYGKVMLAKGVVSALRHGDYTSLEIMGGRIGLDVGLHALEKAGSLLIKKVGTKLAVKIGSKMSSIIGKAAGPIGAVADIGISIYSLTNSVKALNNPNATKYEQNDAVADIIADSIDIAVTATAAILSIVFPPAAPVLAAVALIVNIVTTLFVSVYKTVNHVNELNEEIPLLGYEKVEEGLRYMGGADNSLYLDDLINTKKGDCHLQEKKHTYVIGSLVNSWDGGRWYCGKGSGKACDGIGLACTYHEEDYRTWGSGTYKEYYCECDPDPEHSFDGYDVQNNLVDFTTKRNVFLERWAPDHLLPSDFSYSCKPGSERFAGDRISRQESSYEFLCEGAVGIERLVGSGKFMLYDLKDGEDKILLDSEDSRDSVFVVGDGEKFFQAGRGDDTFILNGPCSTITGQLNGGPSKEVGDSLILANNCSTGDTIEVHVPRKMVTFATGSLKISSIERIIGRRNQVEVIYGDCATKIIAGQGGRGEGDGATDRVVIPHCDKDHLNVTILAEGHTLINFSTFSSGKAVILVTEGQTYLKTRIPTHLEDGEIILKVENVSGLVGLEVDVESRNFQLKFGNGGWAEVGFECDKKTTCLPGGGGFSSFFMDEGTHAFQLLMDMKPSKAQAVFWLGSSSPRNVKKVQGLPFTRNSFHIGDSHDWEILGSEEENDVFFLRNVSFSGSLDGRGGSNTLIVTTEIDLDAVVDIGQGQVMGVEFKNIDSIVGRQNGTEVVTVFCQLRQLDLNGGTDSFPDNINIDPHSECDFDLAVFARGNTLIDNRMRKGNLFIQVGPSLGEKNFTANLRLELYQRNVTSTSGVVFLLNYPVAAITSIFTTPKLGNNHQIIISGSKIDVVGKLLGNSINFPRGENSVQTVIVQIDEGLVAFHTLPSSSSRGRRKVAGIPFIENRFRIQNGSWNVSMSRISKNEPDKDDIFVVEDDLVIAHLDGGGGLNTITFLEKVSGLVKIDENGTASVTSGGKVSTRNVQVWQGRAGLVEVVRVNLHFEVFKVISLNGGSASDPDKISVTNTYLDVLPQPHNLTIVAAGNTFADFYETGRGNFEIYVQPFKGSVRFSANFSVTNETKYTIAVKISPYKICDSDIRITGERVEIQLKLSNASENESFIKFGLQFSNVSDFTDFENLGKIFSPIFISDLYTTEASLLINLHTRELQLLHVCPEEVENLNNRVKSGGIGVKNIFRIRDSFRTVHGGKFDDAFVLENDEFHGQIYGHGGVNSLILDDRLNSTLAHVNLKEETATFDGQFNSGVRGIQVVGGRRGKMDVVFTNCHTELVKLEGGASVRDQDVVRISKDFCSPDVTIMAPSFTQIQNQAERGNFTYFVESLEGVDIEYLLGTNLSHHFKFTVELEQIGSISLLGSNLAINFTSWGEKQFPLIGGDGVSNLPTLQFTGKSDLLITELVIDVNYGSQNGTLGAIIVGKSSFSGNISGVSGVENEILLETEEGIGHILGGELNDNIFLIKSTLIIKEIDGKGGHNRLQLMPGYWAGSDLEVDLRNSSASIKLTHQNGQVDQELVASLRNIHIFAGRESSFEKVFVDCGTISVGNSDTIYVTDPNCNYNLWLTIRNGTRVSFTIEEEDMRESGLAPQRDQAFLDDDDDYEDQYPIDLRSFNSSIFHYDFLEPCTFDIEVDDFSRLAYTPPEVILESFIPIISHLGAKLNVSLIIETGNCFLYSGNPREFATLTNRENITSHLVGFNGTTYLLFGWDSDVHLYPQALFDGKQVIDLTHIISQIRDKTGRNYVPKVVQIGEDLQIEFPEDMEIFSGKIIIVNGTLLKEGVAKVILRSIGMNLVATQENESKIGWGLVPENILIPHGHIVHYAAHDLEYDTLIDDFVEHVHDVNYTCSRAEDDLVVTNILMLSQTVDEEYHFVPSSFIISNYFIGQTVSNLVPMVHIKLGKTNTSLCTFVGVVPYSSNNLVNGTDEIQRPQNAIYANVPTFQDLLRTVESEILEGYPDIPRLFNESGAQDVS